MRAEPLQTGHSPPVSVRWSHGHLGIWTRWPYLRISPPQDQDLGEQEGQGAGVETGEAEARGAVRRAAALNSGSGGLAWVCGGDPLTPLTPLTPRPGDGGSWNCRHVLHDTRPDAALSRRKCLVDPGTLLFLFLTKKGAQQPGAVSGGCAAAVSEVGRGPRAASLAEESPRALRAAASGETRSPSAPRISAGSARTGQPGPHTASLSCPPHCGLWGPGGDRGVATFVNEPRPTPRLPPSLSCPHGRTSRLLPAQLSGGSPSHPQARAWGTKRFPALSAPPPSATSARVHSGRVLHFPGASAHTAGRTARSAAVPRFLWGGAIFPWTPPRVLHV